MARAGLDKKCCSREGCTVEKQNKMGIDRIQLKNAGGRRSEYTAVDPLYNHIRGYMIYVVN